MHTSVDSSPARATYHSRSARARRRSRKATASLLHALEPRQLFATFTVTNAADSGAGSLRQAIIDANASPNQNGTADTIAFQFPVATTIALTSELPAITDSVNIDGTTAAAYKPDTAFVGYNGNLAVTIDGSALAGGANGLTLQSSFNSVRGLHIRGFTSNQYLMGGIGLCAVGSGNVLASNIFTDNGTGVVIEQSSVDNTIGGSAAEESNAVSNNLGAGIIVRSSGNSIEGNTVGREIIVDNQGEISEGVPGNKGIGVLVTASQNTVLRNQIAGNAGDGIHIEGANGIDAKSCTIKGNKIGIHPLVTMNAGNGGNGIYLKGASDSQVGGETIADRNIISGNALNGVFVDSGADDAGIYGNIIGLRGDDSIAAGNGANGVRVMGATGVEIGGDRAAVRNVISKNAVDGIRLEGTTGFESVHGNYIGTDVAGAQGRGNGEVGIRIMGNAQGVSIGGDLQGHANVISGHANGSGILVDGLTANASAAIAGNLVGLDATGKKPIGNRSGIEILNSSHVVIGGNKGAFRNTIAASANVGIGIYGDGSTLNVVASNYIGTDIDGTLVPGLGNGKAGVLIKDASGNYIGENADDSTVTAGNLIAGNGHSGIGPYLGGIIVVNEGGTAHGNSFRFNRIFANNGMSIDLAGDGKNAADALDADGGPNGLTNAPVLTNAILKASGSVTGNVDLSAKPNTTYLIDIYASTTTVPNGTGDSRKYVGSFTTTTDAAGKGGFFFNAGGDFIGMKYLSATASDTSDAVNGAISTSELGDAAQLQPEAPPAVLPTLAINDVTKNEGDSGVTAFSPSLAAATSRSPAASTSRPRTAPATLPTTSPKAARSASRLARQRRRCLLT